MTTYEPWPDPLSIPIVGGQYQTPDGRFPRVTSVLKVLGLGADMLQDWAARVEREACVDAAVETFLRTEIDDPATFANAMLEQLGAPLAHTVRKEAAGDLGTSVHEKVCWWHQWQLGQHGKASPEPSLPPEGERAFGAYQTWWNRSGLRVLRVEQPIWNKQFGFAGTMDVVAEDKDGHQGLVDLKTSKHLYDKFHLQCAGYLMAGRRWAPLKWALLVRLPKTLDDQKPVEVRPLGKMYDRTLTEEQLMASFAHTVALHHLLVGKKTKEGR